MSTRALDLAEDVLKLSPQEKLLLAASMVEAHPSTAAAIARRALDDLARLQLLMTPPRGGTA